MDQRSAAANFNEEQRQIGIYIREDLQASGDGDRQQRLCGEFSQLHFGADGGEIAVYRDVFSPGKLPGYDAMLADARAGKLSAVVCASLERICYGTSELAALLGELGQCGVTFAAIEDHLTTGAPLGRAMAYLAASLDKLDRQGAARRVRDSMLELAKTGRWLGGVTPTGYRSKKVRTEDGAAEFALYPIPAEAAAVRQIFGDFLELNSLSGVERRLTDGGVLTKNGRAYSRFSIRQILENPVYMLADEDAYRFFSESEAELFSPVSDFDGKRGMMAYNKTAQQKDGGSGKNRDMNQWIVAVGRHEGIVPGRDWVRAQDQLGQNKSASFRKPRSAHALMAGMLRCGECGAYMRPKQTSRLTGDGQPMFIYLCERKERTKSQGCQMKNVSGNLLDKVVCDQLRSLEPDSPAFLEQLERNRTLSDPEMDRMEQSRLENRREQIEKTISDLVFSLIKTIDKAAYDYIIRQIDSLHKENASMQQRLDELQHLTEKHPLADEQVAAIQELLMSFQAGFEEMSIGQKRAGLRALVEKAVWDGRRVQVFLYGAEIDRVLVEKKP